jgi:anti-sigma B factor antagonist
MILYRASERRTEVLQPKGVPLAALRGGVARTVLCDEVVQLRPGDVMVQFTDGYSEAFNVAHTEEYGIERIERAVRQAAPRGADAICERLKVEVGEWAGDAPPSDDQTLLIATLAADAPAPVFEAASSPGDPVNAALRRLADAEGGGHGLRLSASLDSLAVIREWLRRAPVLSELSREDAQPLVRPVVATPTLGRHLGPPGAGAGKTRRFHRVRRRHSLSSRKLEGNRLRQSGRAASWAWHRAGDHPPRHERGGLSPRDGARQHHATHFRTAKGGIPRGRTVIMISPFVIERGPDSDRSVVVRVRGELDARNAPGLVEVCTQVRRGGKSLVLNLAGVTFIASSGIGALLALVEEFRQGPGSLRLVSISPAVRSVVNLLNIDRFLGIDENEQAAIETLRDGTNG